MPPGALFLNLTSFDVFKKKEEKKRRRKRDREWTVGRRGGYQRNTNKVPKVRRYVPSSWASSRGRE